MNAFILRFRSAPAAVVSVVQNFGWMLASRGLAAVFSLIYLAIVTRSLGASGFGRFALITSAAQMLSNLLAFQTWQIIVQYGVGHIERQDEVRLSRLYRAAVLLDLLSAVTGIAASVAILHFFADALGLRGTLASATLVFNTITLLSIRSAPLGILRLRDRFSLAAGADSAQPTLRLLGAMLAGLFHPTLQGFLIAWAVAELITAAAHWIAVARIGELPRLLAHVPQPMAVLRDNPGIVRYALTTNLSQSLMIGARQLPVLLVGGFGGTSAAGAFRLATQLARALTTLSQMIARAVFPELVRRMQSVGVGALGALIARTLRMSLTAGAVVFALVAIAGRTVLELIGGPAFGAGAVSLLWLAAAGCVDLAVVAFEPAIAAANRAHLAFYARAVAILVLIAAAALLAPHHGAEGVAAAVFANALVQAGLLGLVLRHLVRRDRVRAITS